MAKVKNNFSAHQDTQPIDPLPSSPSDSGEDKDRWLRNCGDEFMQDMVPSKDAAGISGEYLETQVMDTEYDDEEFLLCRETQAVNLGFETQGGKQLLEASDDLDTQVLDHFYGEVIADSGDDGTDVLEDNSDDPHNRGGDLLPSEDNNEYADEKIRSTSALDAWADEYENSGKVARFASVRSAAFRASAVAARVPSQNFCNSDCPTLLNCHSSGQGATYNSSLDYTVKEVGNQQCPPSMPVEKKNDLQKRNRTARKLFHEDSTEKISSVDLNYIVSQKPGEASQASALNFVDKFISKSCLEFALGDEADCGRRAEEKSKCVPSVKGRLELAKKVSYKGRAIENSIFDWDDNCENEGGGDICRRRKKELFGIASKARESSTLPREQKREMIHKSHRGLGVSGDKRRDHSDSGQLLHHGMTRSRKKIEAAKKILGKELDAVSEDSNNKIFDMPEVVVLGNVTKVAAEAIDALCSGDRSKFDAEASYLTGKKLSLEEERWFSNGVITRQSKGTKRVQAMDKNEFLKRRTKKASPSPDKACGKNIKRSSKSDPLNKEGPCCWKRRNVQSASLETKKNVVDELDEVSKKGITRMFDRRDEVEVGPDTQMAAEAISALHSGDGRGIDPEPNCLIRKKPSLEEGGISSRGAGTRKSKRNRGIQAVDVESLKPKTKKATSIRYKACEKNMNRYSKNDEHDMPDEVVVSSTEKRGGGLSDKHCMSKLLKQTSRGEAEVLSYPKRRSSGRFSQDQDNEAWRSSDPAFDTPVKSKTPSRNVSPICMGDEYHRLSCKDSRKSNTTRELRSLTSPLVEPILETKSTRKRRHLGSIRVLFSQHLDEDVTKHQRKILARVGVSEASSMMEATHLIADNFMRSMNMLEAITSGKPVVTTQWLESIDQANIYVDEDLYILRDSKKEKEFSFNMGVSLARARQYPLLQGRKVFITPNTKPGLNTITTLVKAVHGRPVVRLGRSSLSHDKVPENLLVLSCEVDRDISIPFIERGVEVYSSELLLNGIVTQKLEYERYSLFTDHVWRTRSTIWIRDRKR